MGVFINENENFLSKSSHFFISFYFADILIKLKDDDYERCCKFFSAYFGVAGGIGRPTDFFVVNSRDIRNFEKFPFLALLSKTTHGGAFHTWILFS